MVDYPSKHIIGCHSLIGGILVDQGNHIVVHRCVSQPGHKNLRPNTEIKKTGTKTKKNRNQKKPNCISVSGIQKSLFNLVFGFYFGLNQKTKSGLSFYFGRTAQPNIAQKFAARQSNY
jgi:hypothetical protein